MNRPCLHRSRGAARVVRDASDESREEENREREKEYGRARTSVHDGVENSKRRRESEREPKIKKERKKERHRLLCTLSCRPVFIHVLSNPLASTIAVDFVSGRSRRNWP